MKISRTLRKTNVIYVLVALIIFSFSCINDDEGDVLFTGDDYLNMMQFIDENGDFSFFREIVLAGNMADALSSYNNNGGNSYTLFLPTNDAVSRFINESEGFSSLDNLLEDVEYAAEIVRYHLVNGRIPSNDFPNGALANRTISNYYLTIFFREENNTVHFAVNDESKVISTNIELSNGIIHTIDKMLTPVVYTSIEYLEQSSEFTIFSELLDKCGLADTLNAFQLDELNREVYNEYTLFAESNTLYADNDINSFNDLIVAIDPSASPDQDFTSTENAINKYARYHILERSVYLDEFATQVYNTYGDLPVSVDLDDILQFNKGTMVFDTVINAEDTLLIDYLQIDVDNSNITTRSGAIHQLDHLLFPFLPGRKTVTYQFYEESVINALRNVEGTHTISVDDLEYISLIGTKSLSYRKLTTNISGNSNNDYIEFSGDIDFSFTTPKILAGRYSLKLAVQRGYSYLATIQAFVDNKKVGVVLDPTNDSQTFRTFTIGTVEFPEYSTHTVKISTVIPGRVLIDRIIFQPI